MAIWYTDLEMEAPIFFFLMVTNSALNLGAFSLEKAFRNFLICSWVVWVSCFWLILSDVDFVSWLLFCFPLMFLQLGNFKLFNPMCNMGLMNSVCINCFLFPFFPLWRTFVLLISSTARVMFSFIFIKPERARIMNWN